MTPAELQATPDSTGHYGEFGGMFVPETLMATAAGAGGGIREGESGSDFSG